MCARVSWGWVWEVGGLKSKRPYTSPLHAAGANLADKEMGLVAANLLKCFTILPTSKPACADPVPSGMQRAPVHVPLIFKARAGVDVELLAGLVAD